MGSQRVGHDWETELNWTYEERKGKAGWALELSLLNLFQSTDLKKIKSAEWGSCVVQEVRIYHFVINLFKSLSLASFYLLAIVNSDAMNIHV